MQTQPRSLLLPLSPPLLDALGANNISIDNSAADSCSTFINLSSIPSSYLFSPISYPPFLHSRRHFTVRHLAPKSVAMHEDLLERFKRGKQGKPVNRTHVELRILPQKLNNKVSKYFEPIKKPSDAGPWLDRHESPTSSEILDIEGGNTSNSDIVEIVPNKETGGWESKGEPLHLSPFLTYSSTDLTADAYLSAHYELLREDAVRPLREAICQVRREPDRNEDAFKGTIGIYQDVSDEI
jgi:hypothetical protein